MSLRVVLVDDEMPARDRLRRMLSGDPEIEIAGEAGDVDGAVELLETLRPDLVFLDVQMPGGDGFEVLRRSSFQPRVIFTTAFDTYAVRAFEVRSVDYLLKPYSKARFAEALQRARDDIAAKTDTGAQVLRLLEEIRAGLPSALGGLAPGPVPGPSPSAPALAPLAPDAASGPTAPGAAPVPPAPAACFAPPAPGAAFASPAPGAAFAPLTFAAQSPVRISARRGAKIVFLDPVEILFFEADDTIVHARSGEGRYLVDKTLADLEAQLAPAFFRIHRGYLVNLARIGEIVPGEAGTFRIVLRDEAKTQLPLSRRQAQKLREIIPW